MAGYSPLKITGNETGLVQSRENFLLPGDAYPTLQNAYVWRERILRKKGFELLGRLRRNLTTQSLGNTIANGVQFNLFTLINRTGSISAITKANPGSVTTSANHLLQTGQFVTITGVVGMTQVNGVTYQITVTGANSFTLGVDTTAFTAYISGGTWTTNNLSSQPLKALVLGSVVITMPGPIVFTDQGNGTMTSVTIGNSGVINYATGNITLTTTAGAGTSTVTFGYYPNLPSMGIRIEENRNSSLDTTIFFDQVYAFNYDGVNNQFEEFIPGTTWNAHGGDVTATDFFWSTNYWVSSNPPFTTANNKLFWVVNNTGQFGALGDPPRITDGVTWVDWYTQPGGIFTPQPWIQIDSGPTYLINWLAMLPFRGRMVVFNTWEGPTAVATNFSNRIRWSTIGNPFIAYHNTSGPNDPNTGSWRDDIRGQGGFLDIPTNEDIVSVGFVRDNLVIFCERSTWQLRYTGRSIAPFQIEKVNSEIGGMGPFSSIQFDTSLMCIGDKGIVECDSFKSERIDIKIPDYVFKIQQLSSSAQIFSTFRTHGIRDFINRLAYWTVVPESGALLYPSQRLVYNYENDSWAIFTDTLTTLGNYQPQSGRTWLNTHKPWIECDFPWISNQTLGVAAIVGGNQQGFIEYLDSLNSNDVSLYIKDIVFNASGADMVTSPYHNLAPGSVIGISGIPTGTAFSNLNGGVFGIVVIDINTFYIYTYNPLTNDFSIPQIDNPGTAYIGGGLIDVRDNFSIVSKKFNFLEEGQSIQLGYLDILMEATEPANPGAISMNIYLDYDDDSASNTIPMNQVDNGNEPVESDTFFNAIIPTVPSEFAVAKNGSKFWQRIICPTRANFVTIQYTFSNAQMSSQQQTMRVQIDAQVIWIRRGGRMTQL